MLNDSRTLGEREREKKRNYNEIAQELLVRLILIFYPYHYYRCRRSYHVMKWYGSVLYSQTCGKFDRYLSSGMVCRRIELVSVKMPLPTCSILFMDFISSPRYETAFAFARNVLQHRLIINIIENCIKFCIKKKKSHTPGACKLND